jgi:hypothetical protein
MSAIPVFVTLGSGQPVIIDIPRDAFVGHLVNAVVAKLKLDVRVTANMTVVLLRLGFAPSAAGELLTSKVQAQFKSTTLNYYDTGNASW